MPQDRTGDAQSIFEPIIHCTNSYPGHTMCAASILREQAMIKERKRMGKLNILSPNDVKHHLLLTSAPSKDFFRTATTSSWKATSSTHFGRLQKNPRDYLVYNSRHRNVLSVPFAEIPMIILIIGNKRGNFHN